MNDDEKQDKNKEENNSEDDINNDDKNNLILYADQLHKLYEIDDRDKSEDLIQREKDIKEKYKQIIIKYLLKQKQKELIKKNNLASRRFKRSNKNVTLESKLNTEEEPETEIIVQVKEEEKEKEKESMDNDVSILLEEEENEKEENMENLMKLIYDNSYLYTHEKKKETPIKQEVLDFLNKSDEKKEEKDEENKKNQNEKDNNDSDNSHISSKNVTGIIDNKVNKNKSPIKNFKRKKSKKIKYNNNKDKLKYSKYTLFSEDMEIKEEKGKESEEEVENNNNNNINNEEIFEKKINEFFKKIQMLKNNTNFEDLDILMNEKDLESERKIIGRRLNDFIETISNVRDYERILRPKFNFLSPIKFSTNDLSNHSD